MKKQHLIITGLVVVGGIAAYVILSKKKTVIAKNQDGSEKVSIKTKDGKTVFIVNKNGDYIVGTSLYDAKGTMIATLTNDATSQEGTAKSVFVDEDGNFVAAPDGSLLVTSDSVTFTSPNGTVYLNNQ